MQLENCYHGWNVDVTTCGHVQVAVRAFRNKTDEQEGAVVELAFPEERVKEAVRQHGYISEIVLPEDLVDIYWISVGVAGGISVLIIVLLFIYWRRRVYVDNVK